jgi:hypothetical protein
MSTTSLHFIVICEDDSVASLMANWNSVLSKISVLDIISQAADAISQARSRPCCRTSKRQGKALSTPGSLRRKINRPTAAPMGHPRADNPGLRGYWLPTWPLCLKSREPRSRLIPWRGKFPADHECSGLPMVSHLFKFAQAALKFFVSSFYSSRLRRNNSSELAWSVRL